MTQYIIRRLMFGVILIFLSTIVSFTILKAAPGQGGAGDLDPRLSKEFIEQDRKINGDDLPPVKQYLNWMSGLIRGDLGISKTYHQPVAEVIKPRIGATMLLNVFTLLFTWMVALPLGTWAALRQYKWPDKLLSSVSFIGMSLPSFFLGLLLLWILASRVHWLPPGGLRSLDHDQFGFLERIWDYARHMIVPVVVLTFAAMAGLQRITRGKMLETLRMQYIMTARAKGLSEKRVIYKHALRNAINPLVTILGFEFAGLFAGAALLENVINFPGMGQLVLEGLRSRDTLLVMTTFLIGSVMLVVGNLLADVLLAFVDPRVSYA